MGDTRQYPRTADIKCPFLAVRKVVLREGCDEQEGELK